MPRYIRNTAILAKPETTAGTDAVPTGAADAVLVSNVTITPLESTNVDRGLTRPYFGGSEQLVAAYYSKVSFDVEVAGSGTAATAPAWGDLLLGCAQSEALLATPNRVEYTPASTGLKTLTLYVYDDGVLHKLIGAMGSVKLSAKVGQIPKFMFEFWGTYAAVSAAAAPALTLTAWKLPPVMNKASTVDVTLGATYATGALTGGTVFPSTGLEMDWGNALQFVQLLSSERVDITDRSVTGSVEFDLTAAQEVTAIGDVIAATTQSLAITIGTAAGNKIIVHAPLAQRINPKKSELNGSRLIGFDLRLIPSAGNDETRIVTQ